MKFVNRCTRYGAAIRIAASAGEQHEAEEETPIEPADEQDPERDRENYDEGAEIRSSSSKPPISTITADSGAKPRKSVCRSGCSACRKAALRTA